LSEISTFLPQYQLNCRGKLVDLSRPKLMGIMNITPDSFYDGSRAMQEDVILAKAEKMLAEGATFLDLGGHSTRPNAPAVSEQQEADRVLPAIEIIAKKFPDALLSIDTFRSGIAQKAVAAGAAMVNDVSGGLMDPHMYTCVQAMGVPYVLMHMRGQVHNMMQHTYYENILTDIVSDLQPKIAKLRQLGVNDIVVDLGFGFSKTSEQNYELLQHLEYFRILGCPILTGLSRKSMIWRKLGIEPARALNGTTVLNTVALMKGSNILRVHDVAEAKEAVDLLMFMNEANLKKD
jgi:dihydropteroate synthase